MKKSSLSNNATSGKNANQKADNQQKTLFQFWKPNSGANTSNVESSKSSNKTANQMSNQRVRLPKMNR